MVNVHILTTLIKPLLMRGFTTYLKLLNKLFGTGNKKGPILEPFFEEEN